MSLSQEDLKFVIIFTAEIQAAKGKYMMAYELPILPTESDTTGMGLTYSVDKTFNDLAKRTPYTKQYDSIQAFQRVVFIYQFPSTYDHMSRT